MPSRFGVTLCVAFALAFGTDSGTAQRPGKRATRPTTTPGHEVTWFAAQVALDRAGFSPGEIDGRPGANTSRALQGFQEAKALPVTGQLDEPTIAALGDAFQTPTVTYIITEEDVAGPFAPALPDDMMQLAAFESLGYTSAAELLAERFHVRPALLATMNDGVTFEAGQSIVVPAVEAFSVPAVRKAPVPQLDAKTTSVRVSEASKTLRVEQGDGSIAFQAPVTIGSEQDPLPKGAWTIKGTAVLPVFHYNPTLFWDADPAHAKATLAPGPNSPVGVVWIDLDKEHMGFHGTSEPSTIGRAQSHGCLRLTNWDAMRLATLVGRGTRVILQ